MTTGQHKSRGRVTSLEFPSHAIPQPMTQRVPKAEEAVMTSDIDGPAVAEKFNLRLDRKGRRKGRPLSLP